MVSEKLVFPGNGTPLNSHWQSRFGSPSSDGLFGRLVQLVWLLPQTRAATTVKVALLPGATVCDCGWARIAGNKCDVNSCCQPKTKCPASSPKPSTAK